MRKTKLTIGIIGTICLLFTSLFIGGIGQKGAEAATLANIYNCWMYPNPFSPNGDGKYDTTSFCYSLSAGANVTIKVYGFGREVKTVINNSYRAAGRYYEGWTGTDNYGKILPEGNYKYTIFATNAAGTRTYSGVTSISMVPNAPAKASIYSYWMYPNPYFPRDVDPNFKTTSFCYSLSQDALVTIKVYNYLGEVKTIVNNSCRATGRHYEGWTGTDSHGRVLPNGNYTYVITARNTAGTSSISGITSISSLLDDLPTIASPRALTGTAIGKIVAKNEEFMLITITQFALCDGSYNYPANAAKYIGKTIPFYENKMPFPEDYVAGKNVSVSFSACNDINRIFYFNF